ncbi:RNA polymerase sigma factor [Sediminicola luteus]|uniref:RNA polymerase sigma-70 region 2 domain-containing protein n=1 Tax=Sediminicola luteus TaxID=319238 RepID=A0A2A4GEB4_9FLAO|nr:RNA polymerase sigma factor [Sediminicola luteus]PCE66316.1 hypothetical protein B7P33_03185 [Sediminicola luteus]
MEDDELIELSLQGDKQALEQLLKKHQDWLYNVALNLTSNTHDASDLVQETLIKVITNLSQFKGESSFRTWTFRILKNTFLNATRKKPYHTPLTWDDFAQDLDNTIDAEYTDGNEKEVVKEAKLSCMKAMLLCLTPEQRLVFVLGELFEFPDTVGSAVIETSKAAFRKKLSHTRTQLYQFMNDKCGLVRTENPCRCARKTKGFIAKGYVDPKNLQFQKGTLSKIDKVIAKKLDTYENEGYRAYQELFHKHNFQKADDRLASLKKVLASKAIKDTFEI